MIVVFKIWPRVVFACISLVITSPSVTGYAQVTDITQRRNVVSPTPTPKLTSKPAVPPTPKPTPAQTIDNLQSKIRERVFSPEVRRGRVGIKIVSLASGKVIFENDAEKYFIPASNMKNFTVAAALERLGPDFRFVTSVYAKTRPDEAGTIKGDLRILGRGDISISTAFNNGDYYKGIDNLVDKIAAAGVRRIEGDLIGDESYFKGNAVPSTWEWDDLQWYDGAEVSALPINNNALDITVKPGTSTGSPCLVTLLPQTSLMPIINKCTNTSSGQPRTLKVLKPLGRNVLEISGTMPTGDKGFTGYIAFTHPAALFMELLRQRLQLKNIIVTGRPYVESSNARAVLTPVEIATLESPPFRVIAANTMKPSQNMFTETILWTLGESLRQKFSKEEDEPKDDDPQVSERRLFLKLDSSDLGRAVVSSFLGNIGIAGNSVLQYDGSGLSRHDLVTPSAVVTLYSYMAKQSRYKQAWLDSLTVGGVDGTLKRRFTGTTAEGNIRGKTGTLDQVSALSGYLTTAGGEQVVISVIINGVAEPRTRTSLIDDIVVQLANFSGNVD